MKKLTVVALILVLASCSSNNSKKPSDGEDPGFTNPGVDIEAPIEEDKGYKLIDGTVYFDGEALGTIKTDHQGNQTVVDASGTTIAHIVPVGGGGYQIVIEHAGSGMYKDHYYIFPDENGKWQIDWASSVVDHGWGAEAPIDPKVKETPESKRAALKQKMQHLRASIKAKVKR